MAGAFPDRHGHHGKTGRCAAILCVSFAAQAFGVTGSGVFDGGAVPGFVGSNARGVAVADLDGDEYPDVFLADLGGANRVYFNDGTGILVDSGQRLGASASRGVALGDLNGDEAIDAYVANNGAPNQVYLNNGNGLFVASVQPPHGVASNRCVALGDLDGDGDLDAFCPPDSSPGTVFLNNGAGVFTNGSPLPFTGTPFEVALADLDDDDDLDAVVAMAGGSPVLLNNGHGVLSVVQTLAPASAAMTGVALGDVNGDGAPDVVLSGDDGAVFLNSGAGVFAAPSQTVVPVGRAQLVDVDADTAPDLVIAGTDLRVLRNDGSGVFVAHWQTPVVPGGYEGLALGDLNGDGPVDIVVTRPNAQANEVWNNRPAVQVSNDGAIDVGLTHATLRGSLEAGAFPAALYFSWGEHDGGTDPQAWTHTEYMGEWTGNTAHTLDVTGLRSDTPYLYRCWAGSAAGTVWADPAAAFATPLQGTTVDQQQTVAGNGIDADASDKQWQQEIRCRVRGQLVTLELNAETAGSAWVRVNRGAAWQSDAAEFTTLVTASQPGWIEVDVRAAALNLDAGDRFVIGVAGVNGGLWLESSGPRAYPHGALWLNAAPVDGGERDLAFRTHVSVTKLAVTTDDPVTAVTHHTAQCGGNVMGALPQDITGRGLCWGTAPHPTTADHLLALSAGSGGFNGTLTGLTDATAYHVRAYASTATQTVYGADVAFMTGPIPPPDVLPAEGINATRFTAAWTTVTGAVDYILAIGMHGTQGVLWAENLESGDATGWVPSGTGQWAAVDANPIEGTYSLGIDEILFSPGNSQVSHPLPAFDPDGGPTTWRFQVQWDSFPSIGTVWGVYLMADQGAAAMARDGTASGYVVGVNLDEPDDELKLWRREAGVMTPLIDADFDWTARVGPNDPVGIEVTRTADGAWQVAVDANGGFDGLVPLGGPVVDTAVPGGAHFGAHIEFNWLTGLNTFKLDAIRIEGQAFEPLGGYEAIAVGTATRYPVNGLLMSSRYLYRVAAVGSRTVSGFSAFQPVATPTLFLLVQHSDGTGGYVTINAQWEPAEVTLLTGPLSGWLYEDLDVGRVLVQQGAGGASSLIDPVTAAWTPLFGALPGYVLRALDGPELLAQAGDGGALGVWDLDAAVWTPVVEGPVPGWVARALDRGRILAQAGDGGPTILFDLATFTFTPLFDAIPGWVLQDLAGDLLLAQGGRGGPVLIWDLVGAVGYEIFPTAPGWKAVALHAGFDDSAP